MNGKTHAHRALRCILNEQEHVSEKTKAFERFRAEVSETQVSSPGIIGIGGGSRNGLISTLIGQKESSTESPSDRILRLFEETVRPYSVDDIEKEEPLIETVAEELGRGAAYSLSPETEAGFTESVKQAVLSSTADRQAELRAMDRALEREETSVRSAAEVADDILNARSMEETTEVEIISSGFDELKQMYDEVSGFIDRCGEEIQSRQKTLRATTSNGASAGVRHHKIVAYVYQELPTEYPVMSTITRLNQLCEERKRVLRNQLARTS